MSIRKFYDDAAVATGGGVATLEQPSIANLMAHNGTKNSTMDMVAQPIQIQSNNNTETKEEPTQSDKSEQAATATTTSNDATAKPESQSPTIEPVKVTDLQIAGEPEKVQSWQEVLKNQQPDTVFKELGYDDKVVSLIKDLKEVDPKMLAFLETWKTNGDVTGYLKELTTDYSKMSAEEVMRHQLRSEYPKASEGQLNSLYKQKVINTYSLDPERFTEEETDEGRLLLEAEADKYRDKLIDNQKNFLLPKPPEAKPDEPDLQEQKAQQEFEAYKSTISNDPYIKNIFATKKISLGEGDEKFNFPVDPDHIQNVLFDSRQWAETQFNIVKNPDGSVKSATPKVEVQALTAAFAINPKKFLDEYAKCYKSLGGKAVTDPIDNAKPPDGSSASSSVAHPSSIAEAMAKEGKVSSGAYQ